MTQPKITLVELPPTQFGKLDNPVSKDVYTRAKIPARAIPLLHAILLKEGYKDVVSIDPRFNKPSGRLSKENWERISKSDFLLISSISRTAPPSMELAKWFKRKNPNGIVIAGGTDPTFRAKEWLENGTDVVVRGEGELTLPKLLDALIRNKKLNNLAGISYRRNGKIVQRPDQRLLTEEEFSNLPFPYYPKEVISQRTLGAINAARGCPYNCSFCSVTAFYGHKYRRKNVAAIIKELKAHYLQNPKETLFFVDDNFAPKLRMAEVKELLREMIKKGLNKKILYVQLDVHAASDDEFLDLAKKAGIFSVFVGVESISPETLKSLRKSATAAQNIEAIRKYKRAGFWVHVMTMVGGEGDTPASLDLLAKWLKNGGAGSVQVFAIGPLPGTSFRNEMEKQGRLLETAKDFCLYDGQHVLVRPKGFSPLALNEKIREIYKDFYSFKNFQHLLGSLFPLFPFANARYRFLFDLSARVYVNLVFKEALANLENQEYLKKLRKSC